MKSIVKSLNVEERLLATHIADNQNFETACMSGNAELIRSIVLSEMEKAQLNTKGANKLKDDIFSLLKEQAKVSVQTGENILFFVWNARLSGTGFAVVK
jgi:hypothetical protein